MDENAALDFLEAKPGKEFSTEADAETFLTAQEKPKSAPGEDFSKKKDIGLAIGETALTLGHGMAMWPLGKMAGAVRLMGTKTGRTPREYDPYAARKTEEEFHELLGYRPRTKTAQKVTETVGKAIQFYLTPSRKLGEFTEKHLGPEAGWLVETGGEIGQFAAIPKIRGAVGKGIRKAKGYKVGKAETVLERAEKPTKIESEFKQEEFAERFLKGEEVPQEPAKVTQQKETLEDIYKDAESAKPEFEGMTEEWRKTWNDDFKVESKFRPGKELKDKIRAKQKIESEKGGEYKELTDVLGSTIVSPDNGRIFEAIKGTEKLPEVEKIKNRFEKPGPDGYRDGISKVRMKNGHVAEVQFTTDRMWWAKEDHIGHHLYAIWRDLHALAQKKPANIKLEIEKLQKTVNDTQKMYYDGIDSASDLAAAKRFASSSEMTDALDRMRATLSESTISRLFPPEISKSLTLVESKTKGLSPVSQYSKAIKTPPSIKKITPKEEKIKPKEYDLHDWQVARNNELRKAEKIKEPQERIDEVERIETKYDKLKDKNWTTSKTFPAQIKVKAKHELAKAEEPKPAVKGNAQKLRVPDKEDMKVEFAVMEAKDLVPSHDPLSFGKNERYPEGVQERTYHTDKTAQEAVISHARKLKTDLVLTPAPDAVNGPPIVMPNGIVLGGNSRAMTLQRVYRQHKANADRYKFNMKKHSAQYGLTSEQIEKFKEPVLVRVHNPKTGDRKILHRIASDLNLTPTRGMSAATKAASRGANVSEDTLEYIGSVLTERDMTLREYLGKTEAIELLDRLEKDGVIGKTERPVFVDDAYNQLNAAGKDMVESTIFGNILDNPDMIRDAPRSLQNKLASILSPMARIKARGDKWDISQDFKDAFRLVMNVKAAKNINTVKEFMSQGNLFGEVEYSKSAQTLATRLLEDKPRLFSERWKGYAADAAADVKDQMTLFEPKTQKQSFKERFEEEPALEPKLPKGQATLFSGIPPKMLADFWTENIGTPAWDLLTMQKLPKIATKIPGAFRAFELVKESPPVRTAKRIMIREYRGNLENTEKYIESYDDMKYFQAVGREYGIDLGKRLQALPEKSQLKIGEYITTREPTVKLIPEELKLAREAKQVMIDLGKQAVDAGLLSEETFFKNIGRYMPRLYKKYEFKSLLTKYNLTKPNRIEGSRFKKRKDISKEIREEMGEILTPGYPIAKGILQLTHDIETARFFKGIARVKDWAYVKGSEGPIPEGFKLIEGNKLGALDGAYVHPEIFKDLQEVVHVMGSGEKYWRKALGAWKFGKVIISPKTHARNCMSNSILAHIGGMAMYVQPKYLTKAAKQMIEKGEYWRDAKKLGLLRQTFTNAELRQLFDQVEHEMAGIRAGSLPEKFGKIGLAWEKTKVGMNKAAKLYEAEEQWFKMAKYIHNIEKKGMAPKEAFIDAEKWLFNYAKVSRFQEKYRTKWYGAPFATFTFKALPRIAEATIKYPWRMILPATIIWSLEEAARKKIMDMPEEEKAKKELRPEYMKGNFLGIPNFPRTAFVDDNGKEYYLNLTYIMPWGDIGEGGGLGPIPGSLMPFSQPFTKEPLQQIMNWDNFYKDNIVKEKDVIGLPGSEGKEPFEILSPATEAGRKALKIRGKHLAQAMLPTPVMDIVKGAQALQQKPYRGKIRPFPIAVADAFLGIKLYGVDYMERTVREIGRLNPKNGYVARKIMGEIKVISMNRQKAHELGRDIKEYDDQIKVKLRQLNGLAEQTKKVGERSTIVREGQK